MPDRKALNQARCMNAEAKDNGTANLTLISGKTKTVDLNKC